MPIALRPATPADREFLYDLTWVVESGHDAAGGLALEWKTDSLYVHEIQILPFPPTSGRAGSTNGSASR